MRGCIARADDADAIVAFGGAVWHGREHTQAELRATSAFACRDRTFDESCPCHLVLRPDESDRAARPILADHFVAAPRGAPGTASSRRLALGQARPRIAIIFTRSEH
jgi:hypothetical protein